MEDIVLYRCFDTEVRLLEQQHRVEVFKLLSKIKLDRSSRTPEMYANDRVKLKAEVRYALTKENYNSVGLFKDNKIIGISFSSIQDEKTPWLGYFYIEEKYRGKKAEITLFNYILNVLYSGMTVELGPTDISRFKSMIEFSIENEANYIVKQETANRVKRICEASGSEEIL